MSRTVMVTGASRGLGLEFVRALRSRGDAVLACARKPSAAAEAAETGAEVIALDVAEPASIAALVRTLGGRPIDALINNAGVSGQDAAVGGLSFTEFRRVLDTNTIAPALLAQALLPNLRAGRARTVVNISSQLGSIAAATPGFSYAYNASKAALNMISARLAKDLAEDRFCVVSMCPGWNRTDMGGPNATLHPADSVREMLATIDRLTPNDSGRFMSRHGEDIPF